MEESSTGKIGAASSEARILTSSEARILTGCRNLSMLADFYELTMANGYLVAGMGEQVAHFDMFFRKVPDEGGFALAAGLWQLIEYLQGLRFSPEDIEFLRSRHMFSEEFLDYLAAFRFMCDVWAVPEGMPIFPHEPILSVRGPIIQAQLIETMALLTLNHQSLVTTKAARIVYAAQGRDVIEFGSRRAQGSDGAIYGARAAFIGGCVGTALTLAERDFGIPAVGTMAHSWVQMFDSELDAFRAYARLYPERCTLLVDTYNTLHSGVPNAIRVFTEELLPRGRRPRAVRIDSGDIAYLSRRARAMLDEAGFADCQIMASNSLDEYIIRDMLLQGAAVDIFGVGERLITSASNPVFGGVYKLCAVEKTDGEIVPKIKISENVGKLTLPGVKQTWRLYDRGSGKAIADVVTLRGEVIDDTRPYEIFDPDHTWKRKTVENFTARPLLVPVFERGRLVYPSLDVHEIRAACARELGTLWEEARRFENPHSYYVDLSPRLWQLRQDMLTRLSK